MMLIATCHCGATRLELPSLSLELKSCNCSFCARTGAVWGYYKPGEVRIASALHDRVYSASNGVNQHHFCANCGGNTHGDSPDWGSIYNADGTLKEGAAGPMPTARILAVNMRMLDDVDLSGLTIEAVDGRNNW